METYGGEESRVLFRREVAEQHGIPRFILGLFRRLKTLTQPRNGVDQLVSTVGITCNHVVASTKFLPHHPTVSTHMYLFRTRAGKKPGPRAPLSLSWPLKLTFCCFNVPALPDEFLHPVLNTFIVFAVGVPTASSL